MRRDDGQSSVEVVAVLPLLLVLALGAGQLLAAGAAREAAGRAATAGAMAVLQGGDPEAEARAAAPGWPAGRLTVRRDGRRFTVTARPRRVLPGLDALLSATAHADAGPSS